MTPLPRRPCRLLLRVTRSRGFPAASARAGPCTVIVMQARKNSARDENPMYGICSSRMGRSYSSTKKFTRISLILTLLRILLWVFIQVVPDEFHDRRAGIRWMHSLKFRPYLFVSLAYRERDVFSQVSTPSAKCGLLSVLLKHCIHEYVAHVFMSVVLYRLPPTRYLEKNGIRIEEISSRVSCE